MKIVVLGGSGLVGKQVVEFLKAKGHEVVAASRSTGVDLITGQGLSAVLAGVDAVVDCSQAPAIDDESSIRFFRTAASNLVEAARSQWVKHVVVLSIIGLERMDGSGYMRAKLMQENAVRESGLPFTFVRAAQFFEFAPIIGQYLKKLAHTDMQPIAATDVASALADVAVAQPKQTTIDVAGPEKIKMDDFVRRYFAARDPASVESIITDPEATYFGTPFDDHSLVPADQSKAILGRTKYEDWLRQLS